MNEQTDILGSLASPFGSKSISCLKTPKSGNTLSNSGTMTAPRVKKLADNNNKENEFGQMKAMNNLNLLNDGCPNVTSTLADDKVDCTLETVELLDVDNLLGNSKEPWLELDSKIGLESEFDVHTWLNDGSKIEDNDLKKPTVNQSKLSPYRGTSIKHSNNLKNGLKIEMTAIKNHQEYQEPDSQCSIEPLLIEGLQNEQPISNNDIGGFTSSPMPTSPEQLIPNLNSPLEKFTKPKLGFLTFGDVKSEFGIRKNSRYVSECSEDVNNNHNKAFDVMESNHDNGLNISNSDFIDSQPSTSTHQSLLNKSFDDVVSVVTSSGDSKSGPIDVEQKKISKSQDMTSMWAGGVGRDSLTKLNDIKDVQNVARMQADHLRQTIRMKSNLPNRRLSQSTDRLKYLSVHNIPGGGGHGGEEEGDGLFGLGFTHQLKMQTKNSDSDDSLHHHQAPHVSLLRKFSNCHETGLPHPFSLPTMTMNRPKLSLQHFNSTNKLQQQSNNNNGNNGFQQQRQTLKPPYAYSSNKIQQQNSNDNNSTTSTTTTSMMKLKQSLLPPSRLRNLSSTFASTSLDRSQQTRTANNSSPKNNISPTFQQQSQQISSPSPNATTTSSTSSSSTTSATKTSLRTPSKLTMLHQPTKLTLKSGSKIPSSSSSTTLKNNMATTFDNSVDIANNLDFNNVSNCSNRSNESANSSYSSCSGVGNHGNINNFNKRCNATANNGNTTLNNNSNNLSLVLDRGYGSNNEDVSNNRFHNKQQTKNINNSSNINCTVNNIKQHSTNVADNDNKPQQLQQPLQRQQQQQHNESKQPSNPASSSTSSSSSSSSSSSASRGIPRMSSIPRSRLKPPTKLVVAGNTDIS